jgi:hypothetical protein
MDMSKDKRKKKSEDLFQANPKLDRMVLRELKAGCQRLTPVTLAT